jgi:hypothetical protein
MVPSKLRAPWSAQVRARGPFQPTYRQGVCVDYSWTPQSDLAKAVFAVGFSYDKAQDILYSRMNALQYKFGFTWAYDIASPKLSFIIDCEPIYFNYARKAGSSSFGKGSTASKPVARSACTTGPTALDK